MFRPRSVLRPIGLLIGNCEAQLVVSWHEARFKPLLSRSDPLVGSAGCGFTVVRRETALGISRQRRRSRTKWKMSAFGRRIGKKCWTRPAWSKEIERNIQWRIVEVVHPTQIIRDILRWILVSLTHIGIKFCQDLFGQTVEK